MNTPNDRTSLVWWLRKSGWTVRQVSATQSVAGRLGSVAVRAKFTPYGRLRGWDVQDGPNPVDRWESGDGYPLSEARQRLWKVLGEVKSDG